MSWDFDLEPQKRRGRIKDHAADNLYISDRLSTCISCRICRCCSRRGRLISLPAYLLAGVPVHNAVATNKLSSATGTLISTVRLCKNKFVDWILVLPCIPMALLGSSIGAHLALIASDKLLRYMLIPVLPVVAFYVLRKKNMDEKGGEIARKKQILLCAVCSLAVGCYDGFYGPGTGTFLLLFVY